MVGILVIVLDRPTERKKGLGKKFVELLVSEARTKDIDTLLFAIKTDNKASYNVAVGNGGELKKIENERYYIEIKL